MTVREVVERLGLEVLTGETNLEEKADHGYTSDLLSDVIANAQENSVWITVQRHINVLGVAKLKNITAVITPRSLKVDEGLVEKAKVEGVALLRSELSAFEVSGLLYELLKKG
jgi:hypothetical protein